MLIVCVDCVIQSYMIFQSPIIYLQYVTSQLVPLLLILSLLSYTHSQLH